MQLSPRNPAVAFTVYVAGLSPSRWTSVMAQMFRPIHELTGALTQGRQSLSSGEHSRQSHLAYETPLALCGMAPLAESHS